MRRWSFEDGGIMVESDNEDNLCEQIAILESMLRDSKAREADLREQLDYWKCAHHSLNARVFGLMEQIERLKGKT